MQYYRARPRRTPPPKNSQAVDSVAKDALLPARQATSQPGLTLTVTNRELSGGMTGQYSAAEFHTIAGQAGRIPVPKGYSTVDCYGILAWGCDEPYQHCSYS